MAQRSESGLERVVRAVEARSPPRVSAADVAAAAGRDTWGILFLALTLPNILVIPSVPLLPFLAGAPAIAVLLLLARGASPAALPGWAARRSLSQASARRCVRLVRAASFLGRCGRSSGWLDGIAGRAVCSAGAAMTFLLCLPLPLVNAPMALSTLLLAMALARRDGALAWAAVACGVASAAFMAWAVVNAAEGLSLMIDRLDA